MIGFVIYLVVNAASFMVISKLLPGFTVKKTETAFAMAAVYGLLVAVVGKLLFGTFIAMLLTIPFLGILAAVIYHLFSFVFSFLISVGVLMATDAILEDFEMDGPATAVIASVMLGVVNTVLYTVLHIIRLA